MTCTLHISIVHELSLMWKLYLGSLAFTRVFVLVHHIPAIANSVLERFFTQFPAPGLTVCDAAPNSFTVVNRYFKGFIVCIISGEDQQQ